MCIYNIWIRVPKGLHEFKTGNPILVVIQVSADLPSGLHQVLVRVNSLELRTKPFIQSTGVNDSHFTVHIKNYLLFSIFCQSNKFTLSSCFQWNRSII